MTSWNFFGETVGDPCGAFAASAVTAIVVLHLRYTWKVRRRTSLSGSNATSAVRHVYSRPFHLAAGIHPIHIDSMVTFRGTLPVSDRQTSRRVRHRRSQPPRRTRVRTVIPTLPYRALGHQTVLFITHDDSEFGCLPRAQCVEFHWSSSCSRWGGRHFD